jgi:uncharacterized lipoprotein YddW (UPF0748 family)
VGKHSFFLVYLRQAFDMIFDHLRAVQAVALACVVALLSILSSVSTPSFAVETLDNQASSLLPLKQTLADNSTIQIEAKDVEAGFDETGVEPATDEPESTDETTVRRVSSADFAEFYNDKLRELSQLENAVLSLCRAKLSPPSAASLIDAPVTPFSDGRQQEERQLAPPVQETIMFSGEPLSTPVEAVAIPVAPVAVPSSPVVIPEIPMSEITSKCYTRFNQVAQFKSQFEAAWIQGQLPRTQSIYKQAKAVLLEELMGAAPQASPLAARAIWMDRGTIVNSGSEAGLRQKIQGLARAGFNMIFFETVNAGYPVYPSKILEQSPQIHGWDPLAIAVDEAHKNNIELHAWVWAFAVGNSRLNRILGQSEDYVGPVLSRPELSSAALRSHSGSVYIPEQPERWLSPGKLEAREFLTKLYSEIVQNYAVDGLQLDYIRYPFQKGSFAMGYESLNRFLEETGQSGEEEANAAGEEAVAEEASKPAQSKEISRQAWAAWKAFQVSSFVRELSISLKKINPNLTISTAVFALPRSRRMLMIQQDWETWIRSGWVDLLIPMAYSKSPSGIVKLVDYAHDNSADRALVYPGISLGRLRAPKLLSALETFEEQGVMGSTMFAMAQLSEDRAESLGATLYSDTKSLYLPHRYPFKASLQEMRSLKTVLDAMVAKQKWLSSGSEITSMQRSVGDIVFELEKADAGTPVTLSSRLRMQSRLASIESQLVTWKYATVGQVTNMQLKYLTPMLEHSARLVRFALSRNPS